MLTQHNSSTMYNNKIISKFQLFFYIYNNYITECWFKVQECFVKMVERQL